MENTHTREHLRELQSLPLYLKVRLTKQRIREWVNHYGVDGVYVSFSGGKDSTVLLHLVRQEYEDVPGVFVNTGLEYPEIVRFVKSFKNIEIIRPKKNFRQVIQDYGYPFISKEVSERVYYAQKYLDWWKAKNTTKRPTDYSLREFLEQDKSNNVADDIIKQFIESGGKGTYKLKELYGQSKDKNGNPSQFYNYTKWKFMAFAPFPISNHCCNVMKKSPIHSFAKQSGRVGITAQMASESRLRTSKWLQNGCNGFNLKRPISNPMSFWTEQDVLSYIYQEEIKIASVYGDVIKVEEIEGQLDFEDLGVFKLEKRPLKTTGCKRTGCMFCGYGCHLEKPGEGRFERLKITHPKIYDYIMRPWEDGGLNYKEVIDWLNENGNLNIRY